MKIYFEKVIIHNFLSYAHSEIDLRDKGYCLVSGINNYLKDNALSNGSGKSSWTSAICWALTGETIQGIKQNIKNINIEENLCYVTLEFKVDNDSYVITRYKEPKPDMKVIINGQDKSGKGIRESEEALAQYLPDLTSNLIASIIILGQGLPCKFSNNTPSGRKEVLEKLSKSDFMIEDLKRRLNARNTVLNDVKRKHEDDILSNESKKSIFDTQLKEANGKYEELLKPRDFETELKSVEENIKELETLIKARKKTLKESVDTLAQLNTSLQEVLNEKTAKIEEDNAEFNDFNKQYLARKYEFEANIRSLEAEIKKLDAITDICPTCHQKIPGAKKPDTTAEKAKLEQLKLDLKELNEKKFAPAYESHVKQINEINEEYKQKIENLNSQIRTRTSDNQREDGNIKIKDNELFSLNQKKAQIELNKENHLKEIKTTHDLIVSLTSKIEKLNNDIQTSKQEKDITENHLNIISQLMTLTKRDFRGFLLSNIISYIDMKAKEYALEIFENNELEFKLDGNNIDITYCNKMFESLSGGEKQKVDLIIQFAIRDMMSQYLDFSSNILVLDEITDNLDAIGCNNVLNLISTKLNDIESIFIISHHAGELAIPSDSEMVVVKDRNGISSIK